MPQYTPEFQKSLDEVLRVDPSLKEVVDKHEFKAFLYPKPSFPSSFEYLARGVISQQVSGAAARSICRSFVSLCGSEDRFPSPKEVLEYNEDQLRGAGLSRRKGSYILGLAEAFEKGEISDELLQSLSDDEVVDKIVSLKGFGPWSAQMFLVFYMHRMNVFSPADVGIQRGMRRYIKQRPELIKEASDLEDPPASPGKSKKAQAKSAVPPDLLHMDRIANKFSPHRTAFQMILWKLSDIQMDTVELRDQDEDDKRERLQAMAKRRKINAPVETVAQNKSDAQVQAGEDGAEEVNGAKDEAVEENSDESGEDASGAASGAASDAASDSASDAASVKTEDDDSDEVEVSDGQEESDDEEYDEQEDDDDQKDGEQDADAQDDDEKTSSKSNRRSAGGGDQRRGEKRTSSGTQESANGRRGKPGRPRKQRKQE